MVPPAPATPPGDRFEPDHGYARRVLASGLIETILRAVNPTDAFKKRFDQSLFTRPTHILAFGKASIPMTNAAIECLGDHFARATVLSTPALCAQLGFKNHAVELIAADHPVVTQRNIEASIHLLEHARSIPETDQVLVLISGGGSAMLCAPRAGYTLEYIVETTDLLMRAGAPIDEINRRRSELDSLKAGGLIPYLSHASQIDAYVLSDVIGDDLAIIASGPLVDTLPPSINHTIIASNQTSLDALCAWATHEHIKLVSVKRNATGFADEAGRSLARSLIESVEPHPVGACMGGEPTVDASNSVGVGGPMLELALACALELSSTAQRWTVISLASDGIDGPTNAAGAIITHDMLQAPSIRAKARSSLEEHDALAMCDALRATIRTGPTGTNVNDIAIAIRWELEPAPHAKDLR